MRTRLAVVFVVGTMACLPARAVDAQDPIRAEYEKLNAEIHDVLRAKDPDAETLFSKADAAREQGDHRMAADLYGQVFAKVPTCVDALRRQAEEVAASGNRAKAIELAERAVQMVRSSDNLAAFALILADAGTGPAVPREDLKRAMGLAREAVIIDGSNFFAHLARGQVAVLTGDLEDLGYSLDFLSRRAPNDPTTLFLRTMDAAERGRFDEALVTLEKAHAAGLPDAAYADVKGSIVAAKDQEEHPLWKRLAWWGGVATGAWVVSGLVLFGAGIVLSRMTLARSETVPDDPNAAPTRSESSLRTVYRFVIAVCCAYYYLSMPVLLVLVAVLGGGLLYGMIALGHIPIKLLFIVFIVTAGTLWSILRSVIVLRRANDPGERLSLASEPALAGVLTDVASRVGTRPVDTIFLTPGTDIAVFERGSFARRIVGQAERCLILGAGALDGMALGPFRAILAHEYGHFSNRDTAGGGFALAVRQSMVTLAGNLARSGAAAWYNPAWIFVNGFYRVFLRISQGASRLQEVLADRWAALLYGGAAFETGLRHVIESSVRFNAHVNATINEVANAKKPLPNLYQYQPLASVDAKSNDEAVKQILEREPSPYDSHPRPVDRFRWVHALNAPGTASPADTAPAWSLFRDRQAIEERMTRSVREAVRVNHGVQIAER